MADTRRLLAIAGLALITVGSTAGAAFAAEPTQLSSAPETISGTFMIRNGTGHPLTADATNDSEYGISGIPHVVAPGNTTVTYQANLQPDWGTLDPTNHVIIDYQNGTGATYEFTIMTSAPKTYDSSIAQQVGFTSYKNGREQLATREMFDVDTQMLSDAGVVAFN